MSDEVERPFDEAAALRWGCQLGDAYVDLWGSSEPTAEAEAEAIVEAEVYRPRRDHRRRPAVDAP
jgi:hypothetical protein